MAQESATPLVREVEDQATLAEREAQERVSTMEVESDAVLASARGGGRGLRSEDFPSRGRACGGVSGLRYFRGELPRLVRRGGRC
jgi:hypothetical protein